MVVYWLYSLLFTVGFIILSPYYVWRLLKTKRTLRDLPQRFGYVPKIHNDGPVIWIHAVSVGETLAIQGLVQTIRQQFGNAKVVVSTTTETGQAIARSKFGHTAETIYFPFDWRSTVKRAIRRLNPSVVLIIETEIWPNFLHVCHQKGIPTILVSGRISLKSYNRYKLARPLMKGILGSIDLLLMQSETDALRIIELGAEAPKVEVIGDLKLDVKPPASEAASAERLDSLLSLSRTKHLIVAGSTAAGEEDLILEAFQLMKSKNKLLADARLLLAPRRPERFQEVERTILRLGVTYVKRSQASRAKLSEKAEIIILDSIGELVLTYWFAKVVILGGSFLNPGKHNYVEAVVRGACVVVGPRYEYEPEGEASFVLYCLSDVGRSRLPNALADSIQRLLLDDGIRNGLVSRARKSVERSQGATDRVISYLSPLLSKRTNIPSAINLHLFQI
jgi:3-deoxy-D-manno-octulosonic-acid transferase